MAITINIKSCLLSVLAAATVSAMPSAGRPFAKRQNGPTDPETSKDCTFWETVTEKSQDCSYFESLWSISHDDFVTWNPSVKADCSGIIVGNSYCVEVNFGVPLPTSTKTTSTAHPDPTTNLPSPTQGGLTKDCTTFYKAKIGDTCDKIVTLYRTFNVAEFVKWNPAVGADCTSLWADTYYCVGIPGTPTNPPSQIPTATITGTPKPSPTQSGLISTCSRFYLAKTGDNCASIVSAYQTFVLADFLRWNPAVGNDCSGLWAETYYCVGIPGTPTRPTSPSTTSKLPVETCNPGAPQPTQPGAICECNKWHQVKNEQTTCDAIIAYNKISADSFYFWNPKLDRTCKGLWVGYHVCVGATATPTQKPTTTTTSKAPVETCNPGAPQPTQPGAICH